MTHSTNPSDTHTHRLHTHRARVHRAHREIVDAAAQTVAEHYDHTRGGAVVDVSAGDSAVRPTVTAPPAS